MLDKSEILRTGAFKNLRHRWEMPMIWLSFLMTAAAVVLGFWIAGIEEATLEKYFGTETGAVMDAANSAFLIFVLPIGVFFFRFYTAANAKANAIRVGPNQFPQLWEMYQALGMCRCGGLRSGLFPVS